MLAFGPIPSRRLGRSLGINNIPPKSCSYDCLYCQVGSTAHTEAHRRVFFPPEQIVDDVSRRVDELRRRGESIDVLAFVPDGEPTLDVNLGAAIRGLRPLGIPVAVITNGSLLGDEDVRADLMAADWVSLKVDTVDETTWRKLNRADPAVSLDGMLAAMRAFAAAFEGTLVTETMLLRGVNDGPEKLQATAAAISRLAPQTAYLAIPTRPPAEPDSMAPDEVALARAYAIFAERLPKVECLAGYDDTAYGFSGDVARDVVGITSVHPMRESEVRALLAKAGAGWDVVEALISDGELALVDHADERFVVRRLPGTSRATV